MSDRIVIATDGTPLLFDGRSYKSLNSGCGVPTYNPCAPQLPSLYTGGSTVQFGTTVTVPTAAPAPDYSKQLEKLIEAQNQGNKIAEDTAKAQKETAKIQSEAAKAQLDAAKLQSDAIKQNEVKQQQALTQRPLAGGGVQFDGPSLLNGGKGNAFYPNFAEQVKRDPKALGGQVDVIDHRLGLGRRSNTLDGSKPGAAADAVLNANEADKKGVVKGTASGYNGNASLSLLSGAGGTTADGTVDAREIAKGYTDLAKGSLTVTGDKGAEAKFSKAGGIYTGSKVTSADANASAEVAAGAQLNASQINGQTASLNLGWGAGGEQLKLTGRDGVTIDGEYASRVAARIEGGKDVSVITGNKNDSFALVNKFDKDGKPSEKGTAVDTQYDINTKGGVDFVDASKLDGKISGDIKLGADNDTYVSHKDMARGGSKEAMTVDGESGSNTLKLSGKRDDYKFYRQADGSVRAYNAADWDGDKKAAKEGAGFTTFKNFQNWQNSDGSALSMTQDSDFDGIEAGSGSGNNGIPQAAAPQVQEPVLASAQGGGEDQQEFVRQEEPTNNA